MSQFEIYTVYGTLTAQGIKDAIGRYYQRHQRLPYAINAHHTNTQRLRVLLTQLELDVPVYENGGVLQHELWMQTNDTKKDTPHE